MTVTAGPTERTGDRSAAREPDDQAPGLVTFCVGPRLYAASLTRVREVVRLVGLLELDGMDPPLAGVVDLRGAFLPVLDLRHDRRPERGDVLVLEDADGTVVGVAVDQVRAVLDVADLPPAPRAGPGMLPSYVLDVLVGADGPVFRVDLPVMARAPRAPQT